MTEAGMVSVSVEDRKAGGAQCDCTCLLLSNESNVKILKVKKMKRSRAREEILSSTSWGETFDRRTQPPCLAVSGCTKIRQHDLCSQFTI